MKAAVCREFAGPLHIEEVHLADPGVGEVRVRIRACAICHSDIAFIDGAWGGDLPAVFGHEASGIVEAVGSGVTDVAPGDPVAVTLVRACGRCSCCEAGYYGSCETTFPLDETSPLRGADGAPIGHGLGTGAFAEAVVVDRAQIVPIDDDIGFDTAALLACGVITGYGAVVNTAGIRAGSRVAVVGTGGVGLNSVQGAAIAGAAAVIAIDLSESKREAARRFGATHTIDPRARDVAAAVRAATGGCGADAVFVTVGAKAAFDRAIDLLAPGGAAVIVGMPANGVMSDYDPGMLVTRSQRILGSKMGSSNIHQDIPKLIALYRQGRLKLDELISGRYRLDQINDAIASAKSGEALRNVVVMG